MHILEENRQKNVRKQFILKKTVSMKLCYATAQKKLWQKMASKGDTSAHTNTISNNLKCLYF